MGVGTKVGDTSCGLVIGMDEGSRDGYKLGASVGVNVGSRDGYKLGASVGVNVG